MEASAISSDDSVYYISIGKICSISFKSVKNQFTNLNSITSLSKKYTGISKYNKSTWNIFVLYTMYCNILYSSQALWHHYYLSSVFKFNNINYTNCCLFVTWPLQHLSPMTLSTVQWHFPHAGQHKSVLKFLTVY